MEHPEPAPAPNPNDGPATPPPPPAPQSLTLTVKDSRGGELTFKLKSTTKFGKAMDAFSAKTERPVTSLRFMGPEGQRILPDQTVEEADLMDGDTIDVHEEQLGGGDGCCGGKCSCGGKGCDGKGCCGGGGKGGGGK